MGRAYVFLADGFEEIEGLTVVDILRRGGVETCTVSVSGSLTITGGHDIAVQADALFEETDLSDADVLILPGGKVGTENLKAHGPLAGALRGAKSAGTLIAAICAAPTVLGGLGLLRGEKATCYPGLEGQLEGAKATQETVQESGQFITSRGMGTSIPFALAVLAKLRGQETADAIGKSIVWQA